MESAADRRRFSWIVAATFVALTLPRLLLHEPWRDEAWLWLAVTESRSWAELLAALARTGQGYLFPVLAYLASFVSTSFRALQILHLALAGGAAFVFARWAPFGRAERALVLLGYFPFYDYAVVSRHYAVGALLLWLACAAIRQRRLWLLGAALGLLCQTTVYGFVVGLAIAAGWFVERWSGRNEARAGSRTERALAAGFAVAGAVAGFVQLLPAPGTRFAPEWHLGWEPARALDVLRAPWRAFVPLPAPTVQFWTTNFLDPWPRAQAALGGLALVLAVALLWRWRVALTVFGVGAAGLLAFGYLKYVGTLRHQGHLWLLLLAALWLGRDETERSGREPTGRAWRSRVLVALLAAHCAAALYASWVDLRQPFSNGPATAALLRAAGLDREPLLGHREPPAAAVALPLGRPLYAPSRGAFASRPDWGPTQREMTDPELRCAARQLARREGRDIVLVINRELPAWAETDPLGARLGAIVSSEDFHLYRLRNDRLAATAAAAVCGEVSR